MSSEKLKNKIYEKIDALNKDIRLMEDLKNSLRINFIDDKYYAYLNGEREALKYILDYINTNKEF